MKAELYGILLFGRTLRAGSIVLQTEHESVADLTAWLLSELYGITPERRIHELGGERRSVILSVSEPEQAYSIYSGFGYNEKTVSLRINRANIETEEDTAAFLRGGFLSCGSMVDPGKDYHLEFVTPYLNLSRDLAYTLSELEFEPKTVRRKGNNIVYFKDSGQIEDLLTFMGAAHQSLELMNVKVYKDLRNKANRLTNCETANIDKTVNASAAQVEAIKKLIGEEGFDALPAELREIARLRLDNPDVSLRGLGGMLSAPLSRSGVNHRLNRLLTLAHGRHEGIS